jgi:hypothetical protein
MRLRGFGYFISFDHAESVLPCLVRVERHHNKRGFYRWVCPCSITTWACIDTLRYIALPGTTTSLAPAPLQLLHIFIVTSIWCFIE